MACRKQPLRPLLLSHPLLLWSFLRLQGQLDHGIVIQLIVIDGAVEFNPLLITVLLDIHIGHDVFHLLPDGDDRLPAIRPMSGRPTSLDFQTIFSSVL